MQDQDAGGAAVAIASKNVLVADLNPSACSTVADPFDVDGGVAAGFLR